MLGHICQLFDLNADRYFGEPHLKFVVSNSSWKGGKLTVQYRQPFDLFSTWEETMKKGPISERLEKGQNENWLLR
jgi:hypothetical protein